MDIDSHLSIITQIKNPGRGSDAGREPGLPQVQVNKEDISLIGAQDRD